MIGGLRVTVDKFLCRLEFAGWRKNHRKARINRKWHKRYGPILRCKGSAYEVAGTGLVCCPCVMTAIMRESAAAPVPPPAAREKKAGEE